VSDGHWIRVSDFKIRLSSAQEQSIIQIEEILQAANFQTPKIDEIINQLNFPPDEIKELVSIMVGTGKIVRIGPDILFLDEQIFKAKQLLSQYFQTHPEITVGEVSSLLSSTRKYVVPLLEYFDREGFTERREDVRVKKAEPGKT